MSSAVWRSESSRPAELHDALHAEIIALYPALPY
jgi:hypothetical protein